MSNYPTRSRLMTIYADFEYRPEQDLPYCNLVAQNTLTSMLQSLAIRCGFDVVSVSYTLVLFPVNELPEPTASLMGTVVYIGGSQDIHELERDMSRLLIQNRKFKRTSAEVIDDFSGDGKVITIEVTLQ